MIRRRRNRKFAVSFSLGILLAVLYTWVSIRRASRPMLQEKLQPSKRYNSSPNQSYLPAEIAFQTYQLQHSQEALLRDYNSNATTLRDRRYAIAYYWCPQRMGNILHSFFNSFAWAMIHNRTLLWKYHGTDNVGSEVECQAILERAPWLPAYEEWETTLFPNEQTATPVDLVDFNQTETYPLVLYPQIPDVLAENSQIIRNGWIEDPSHPRYLRYVKSLPRAFQTVALQLYSEGKEFLYGMLYAETFTLKVPVKKRVFGYNNTTQNDSKVFSIALHSRHTVGADDGSYINQETKCLNELLSLIDDDSTRCEVYIMSDRPKTVDMLISWLLEQNCTAVIANHTVGPRIDDIPEHGPWSGAGFLLDLQVVGEAQSGVVGDRHRSSTALVFYSVEYNRRKGAVERGETLLRGEMPICELPNKPLSGYSYGHGSPTFRHHSNLDPLPPIGMMNMYKEERGHVTPGQGRYVVSHFDFESSSPEGVYGVLNSFFYSIVSNRTFVLLEDCEGLCVKEHYSLATKAWLDCDLSAVKSDFVKIGTYKAPVGGRTIHVSMENEKVIQLQFEQRQLNLAEWSDMIGTESANQLDTLQQMFALGGQLLYGLLFHEVFDIVHRIDPPWQESPSTSIVIDMEDRSISGEIETCLDSMLEEPLRFTPDEESCHVFLLTSKETANTTNSDLLTHRCSFSPIPIIGDANWWRNIDLASRARSGWIAPINSSLLKPASSLIKERMEYYRHHETWILGRDPFYIPKLQECTYPDAT